MKRVWLVCLLISLATKGISQEGADSLLTVLKNEIGQRHVYVNQKLRRIEQLRKSLPSMQRAALPQQFDLYNALYHEYKTFIYDSAFWYAQRLILTAYKLHDKSKIGYARVKLSFILVSSGMFKETFDSLRIVEVKYLADTTRIDYYRLLARAYSDLTAYNKDRYYRKFYETLGRSYMDSALMECTPRSYSHYYFTALRELHSGNYQNVISTVQALLKHQTLSHPQLAVNYHDMAEAYKALGDTERTLQFLILSSISDLRAPTKETTSMYLLAKLLYDQGDTQNAYIFIKQALEDAEFYGARQRKVEIGSILPVIAADQINNVEGQRKRWLVYSAGVTLIVLLVIVFSVIIFKQLKKLKAAELVITQANQNLQEINHKLLEADKIKEEYIGYYFSNNSQYIDKIESFKKSIDRKLQNHKVDDIRYFVSTINPDQEREELYFNFDKIFLKLFPDFVTTFNSYFEPGNRIVLKENQLLNTELRIFALIRLGIHDAEKIARILGYSVNTIYAYKNRIKSKSILPNDQFEEKIKEIKTVSLAKP